MNAASFWQAVRLATMVLAIAGIIYALEFLPGGIALWFWVALLGIGFVGSLVSFRLARRRNARNSRQPVPRNKKRRR
ncbi:MAG: hypothetical protein NC209_02265 [Alistipes sp.]|nr:hypothetical protein [Alistipes senegalensis]MCM1249953.1 hypothetical protein [Alistipes sp.]